MKFKLTTLSVIVLSILLLFGCEEEIFSKDTGQYALAINYQGTELLELHFFVDDKDCGLLSALPQVNPTYVDDCKKLKKAENLTNVFILKEVTPGKHVLTIKTPEGRLVNTLEFQMVNKECVLQNVNISLD
ncbi:hypothetical protein [Pedobacter ureilyticus]|uniref:Lipoprotein n=1 Tax=Pedobacter ureilyticus TaxID=1393051 RepID=A0ABW9J2A4_9SPHI|nr:hypothetical protein [Pedobacter helvus]